MQGDGPGLGEVLALFDEVEPLDAAARAQILGDSAPALALRVRAMLDAAGQEGILDHAGPAFDALVPLAASLAPGSRIGGFAIERLIGRGGMGEVYLAHRADAGFDQKVALKLLRIDAVPDQALFARERRLLARLEHPGIVRLIDGGVTSDGRPWLAMSYIDGLAIDRWCETSNPALDARFDAFRAVCEAVAFAHANLVVHRDLKPSNILIDARGQVHLLDFGIAKLIDEGEATLAATGALMTPDYAAPEQLANGAVTIATDIHALGLVLYQLLAGTTPWGGEGSTLSMLIRRIAQEDPAPPSKVAGRAGWAIPAARLRGDLDAIVLKALRKDPAARYASALDMAEDVRRHQQGLPVRARAGSRRYTALRTLRRYRWGVAAIGAILLTLFVGAGGIAMQARRAAIERDNALAEARRSDSIVQTLTLMFGPGNHDSDQTLKQTLDQSAQRMLATLDGSARSGAAVNALSDLYVNMQDAKGSHALLGEALARRIGGDDPITAARMKANLADAALSIGAQDDVRRLLDDAERVLAADPSRHGAELQQIVGTRAGIARRKGDYDTAIRLLSDGLPEAERAFAANDSALLTRYNNLLVYLIEANRLRDAAPVFARVDRVLAHPGQRDTIQALGIDQLRGAWLLRRGDPAAAERIAHSIVERRGRLFGESAGLAVDLAQLAKAQMAAGRFAEARASLLAARPMAVRFLGESAIPVVMIDLTLVQALAELDDVAEGAAHLARVRSVIATMPTPNPLTPQLAMTEAILALHQGDKLAAARAAERARAGFAAMGPAGAYGQQATARVAARIAAMR